MQPPYQSAPPSLQEELVRKYSIVEKVIRLKKQINETLEKWMESYYHILFDNLPKDQLERKRLGELLTIVGGGTPSTKVPEYWTKEGGIPWIGISDLTSNKGKFINKGEKNITEEGERNSSTKLIPEDSILFSCKGTVGAMGMNDVPMCFSRNFFGIFSKNEAINYCWFLLSQNVEHIRNLGKGTVMNGIGQQDLRNFEVNLPPQDLISQFNQVCEPFFQLQKTNEQEIRELLKLQKYFIELTN